MAVIPTGRHANIGVTHYVGQRSRACAGPRKRRAPMTAARRASRLDPPCGADGPQMTAPGGRAPGACAARTRKPGGETRLHPAPPPSPGSLGRARHPGPRDPGFSVTRLTFQITHATDSDTNVERDYIIAELTKNHEIGDVTSYPAGDHLAAERVNRYITDGEVRLANLA